MSKIKTIKPSTIRRALWLHQEWLDSKNKYKRKGRQLHPTTEAIRKTSFDVSDFSCANFSYADFSNLDLDNTDFQGAIFQDVSWKNTDFRHMLMKNVLTANLEGLTVIQCQFEVSGNQNEVLQYWVEPQIFVDGTGKTFPSLSAFQKKIEKMKEDGVFDSFDSPDGEYDYKVYQSAIKYISDLSELYQKQK